MQLILSKLLICLCITLLLSGCGEDKKKRAVSFMPNMHDQTSLRAQEPQLIESENGERSGRGMRTPVQGTVPTHYAYYNVQKGSPDAKNTRNPFPMSLEVLRAGRRAYNIYCLVCHGERGDGDGNIIPSDQDGVLNSGYRNKSKMHFPPPPALHSEKVNKMKDGELYNYLTHGGAIMPSYGHLSSEMRWSIVHYLRVLNKASHASEEEFKDYQGNKEKYKDATPKDIVHHWQN